MLLATISSSLALSLLVLPSAARVIWVAEEFDPLVGRSLLETRDTATCGGEQSLTQCGGGLPSDFCCNSGTTCLVLETSSSVKAAICCPNGSDCSQINPISCNESFQNTTNTQLHVDPPQKLNSCGDQCCPMGYNCTNGQCIAQTAPSPVSQSKPSSTSTSTGSSGTSTSTASAANEGVQPSFGNPSNPNSNFNGRSFAAGFVPGIAIGALIAGLIILLCIRRRRNSSKSYVEEKAEPRDTLTDLSTMSEQPSMHGRKISEPKADPSTGYRTDFLRHSPAREDAIANGYGYGVKATSPATPTDEPPRIKALFSRSPFMNASPSSPPATQTAESAPYRPRTTFFFNPRTSLKISPVRALKKQKSTHSLRRHMHESSQRPHLSRNGSTETIQVLMPSNDPYTPDRPQPIPESAETLNSTAYQDPKSATTWNSSTTGAEDSHDTPDQRAQIGSQTPYTSSSRYPSDIQPLNITPTRPPVPRLPENVAGGQYGFLGSPYTPTKKSGGLAPPGMDNKRDTTFSTMMEKAGLRKSELLVHPESKTKK
jgi:hypothetical protein